MMKSPEDGGLAQSIIRQGRRRGGYVEEGEQSGVLEIVMSGRPMSKRPRLSYRVRGARKEKIDSGDTEQRMRRKKGDQYAYLAVSYALA